MNWELKPIKIQFNNLPQYGFLAVTPHASFDGTHVITHVDTGFALPRSQFVGLPTTKEDLMVIVENIVNDIPEADQLFTKMVNGELSQNCADTAQFKRDIRKIIRYLKKHGL